MKNILIFSVLFLFFSCKQSEEKIISTKETSSENEKIAKELLFYRSKKEFQNIFSNASKKIKHPTHKPDKKALDK